MARSIVSPGMLWERAARTAVRSRGLAFTSPPPRRAATVISLMSLVKIFPRLASLAAFLCLMVLHLEWPDIGRLRRDEGTRATDAATSGEVPHGLASHNRMPVLDRRARRGPTEGPTAR